MSFFSPAGNPPSIPIDRDSALFSSSAPLARASIATDALLEHRRRSESSRSGDGDGSPDNQEEPGLDNGTHSMTRSYRRPSFLPIGQPRAAIVGAFKPAEREQLTQKEREAAREDERSLLRDNDIIPPKHPRRASAASSQAGGLISRIRSRSRRRDDEVAVEAATPEDEPSESTTLLGRDPSLPYGGEDTPENIDRKWEEAVAAGKIQTTWRRELKVLAKYSWPLVLTFILQYSLTATSVFTIGHLGTTELGAVCIGSMTASITGYAVFQGLATSLDTLCAQAYGSGNKQLVGLNVQRMTYFLLCIMIPIAVIWLSSESIIAAIVPEKETARLAGLYLKILVIGMPGYLTFEAGKRFVQAQGLFSAMLWCLLILAPLNMFMHWLFVWHLGWGFIGAPISVVVTESLLPIGLFLYVYFVAGRECWGGFSSAALRNWGPMVRLAIPGLIMVLAEYLAFEILTLAAARIGPIDLAAQSVVNTILVLAYMVPFPISIAGSTRIANLIGATLADAAKTQARVLMVVSACVGLLNVTILGSLRQYLPRLATNDPDVARLAATVLPLCACFQLFDALAAACNGILRGIGRQEIGGYVGLFCYYAVALPLSFSLCFGLNLGLLGLWSGPAVGLFLVSLIEGICIYRSNWDLSVEQAKGRNDQA